MTYISRPRGAPTGGFRNLFSSIINNILYRIELWDCPREWTAINVDRHVISINREVMTGIVMVKRAGPAILYRPASTQEVEDFLAWQANK